MAPQCDVLLIFGASAITDRRDVIPAAIEAFGGRIDHFGMPVDPGNLLLLGARGPLPIVGAPRLRALAQGKRLRLGAAAPARRCADRGGRHYGHGGRRPLDGNRLASATAPRRCLRSPPFSWPPAAPRASRRRAAAKPPSLLRRWRASRWCATPPRRRWARARCPSWWSRAMTGAPSRRRSKGWQRGSRIMPVTSEASLRPCGRASRPCPRARPARSSCSAICRR